MEEENTELRGKEDKESKVNLIIKSNIRKYVSDKVGNVAEEVEGALNEKVREMLDKACERAKQNYRKTLHARDL